MVNNRNKEIFNVGNKAFEDIYNNINPEDSKYINIGGTAAEPNLTEDESIEISIETFIWRLP